MYTKPIKFEDYNGIEKEFDYRFNLTETELRNLNLTTEGGIIARLEKLSKNVNVPEMSKFFDGLILSAYGELSDDGVHFLKSEELTKNFMATPAYDILMTELLSNPDAAVEFLFNIIPSKLAKEARAEYEKNGKAAIAGK